jgi:phospholipid-binding lipoprotein MlaA
MAFKAENEVSLTIGDYEDMKKASVDPYAAVRDAYVQYRARMVEK